MITLVLLVCLQDAEPMMGRFGGKRNLVARGGGGVDTEDAVLLGLKWLSRHQSKEGAWLPSLDGCCGRDGTHPGTCKSDYEHVISVPDGKPLADEEKKYLDDLAAQLGAESLEDRERAARHLVEFGERAAVHLKAKMDGEKDTDRAGRLKSVIVDITKKPDDTSDAIIATSWALQSFVGAGYLGISKDTHGGICFGDVVAGAVAWLEKQQDATGLIGDAKSGRAPLAHALATDAICQLCALGNDEALLPAAKKAVAWLVGRQKDGAWGDDGVTAAVAWALRSAECIPLDVSKAKKALLAWAEARTMPKDGPGLAAVGSALLLGGAKSEKLTALAGEIGVAADHDAPWLTAQLGSIVFAVDGAADKRWKAWNEAAKRAVKTQIGPARACDRGSWSAVEAARPQGRVAATAGMVLVFETYYRWRGLEK